jgi:hypothetical protein
MIRVYLLFAWFLCSFSAAAPAIPIDTLDREACKAVFSKIVAGKERGKTLRVLKALVFSRADQATKIERWLDFVSEISKVNRGFSSTQFPLHDGSFLFVGHLGESLLIAPNGDVYLLSTSKIKNLGNWIPPYDKMRPMREKIQFTDDLKNTPLVRGLDE